MSFSASRSTPKGASAVTDMAGRSGPRPSDSGAMRPAPAVHARALPDRRVSAFVLTAMMLLAGCSSAEGDDDAQPPSQTASATTTSTPAPMLVRELPGLLLNGADINRLMGATEMQLNDENWSKMFSWNTPGGDCAAAWIPIWKPVYEGSGWMGFRGNLFTENPGSEHWTHRLWQAVVAFPLPADAAQFYAKQVASWKTCNGRRINEHDADDPNDNQPDWTLGQATDTGGVLTMSKTEDTDTNWSCQHALTVRNNVAIDIRACGEGINTQAEAVAKAIAEKVPT